jgi:hypothetical protein
MHPMVALGGTLLVLGIGFFIIYQVAKHHDMKNQH